MFQVYNMGHRMELYCRPRAAESIISTSERFGIAARVVGRIEASPNGDHNLVTLSYRGHELRYGPQPA
jgi:phosphoribosylformylglycinamidine cyclo-ligase